MDVREKRPGMRESRAADSLDAGGGSGALDAAREEAEGFLRAGDRAIERALSGDSAAFLLSSMQEGGE